MCDFVVLAVGNVMIDAEVARDWFCGVFKVNQVRQGFPHLCFNRRRGDQDEIVDIDRALDTQCLVIEEAWLTLKVLEASFLHTQVQLFVPHGAGLRMSIKRLIKDNNWVSILWSAIRIEPAGWP